MAVTPLPERKSWQALGRHHEEIAGVSLRDLFAGDPGRGERLTAEAAGLYLDYSKNRVTDETMRLLVALAAGVGRARAPRRHVPRRAHQRVGGPRRAARGPPHAAGQPLVVDGVDVVAQVHEVLDRMADFAAGSGRASGRATPASRSGTSSTSASAARTSAR